MRLLNSCLLTLMLFHTLTITQAVDIENYRRLAFYLGHTKRKPNSPSFLRDLTRVTLAGLGGADEVCDRRSDRGEMLLSREAL